MQFAYFYQSQCKTISLRCDTICHELTFFSTIPVHLLLGKDLMLDKFAIRKVLLHLFGRFNSHSIDIPLPLHMFSILLICYARFFFLYTVLKPNNWLCVCLQLKFKAMSTDNICLCFQLGQLEKRQKKLSAAFSFLTVCIHLRAFRVENNDDEEKVSNKMYHYHRNQIWPKQTSNQRKTINNNFN